LDVRQQSKESGKRKAKLDRIQNLNSSLNMHCGLFEFTLLGQAPTQEAVSMPGESRKAMLLGQTQEPIGFVNEVVGRVAQSE